MFRKLRIKLTVLYATLAGIVLMAVSVTCMNAYEIESREAFSSAFESAANAVVYKLQNDKTTSVAWLAQIESDEKSIISIEDAGVPMSFGGSWSPITPRDELLKRADDEAGRLGLKLTLGTLTPQSVSFEVHGDAGDMYLARATIIPDAPANPVRVVMLRDLEPEFERVRVRRAITLTWAAIGLIALCAAGYIYSGRAVKPAQESFKRQTEFTAMASHELKTPLSVLTASVDALKTYPQKEETMTLLDNISAESGRMARLVDDLLILARSDAGEWRGKLVEVDMDTLIISLSERFLPAFAEKGITVDVSLPDDELPMLRADEGRLTQIICILLDNAKSYTQYGGRVKLGAYVRDKALQVIVEDNGPGVSEQDKPRIFDRFYQSDKSRSNSKHFGLGLSVAFELARLHGGKITLEDVKPHGARFILSLPLR